MTENSIGGYHGLELPVACGEYHQDAYRYQSARAAFLALLLAGRPNRAWIPWYICESMIEVITMAGIPISRYRINNRFEIADDIQLGAMDWLVYVNYFGVCDVNVDKTLQRFPHNSVIVDNSQAFFSNPKKCLATIYSARKFFGVPDGGYLVTKWGIEIPKEEDDGSLGRCDHLLKRLAISPEAGYADYKIAEDSLKMQYPKRMSQMTQRLLSSIDYETVRARRRDNARIIHEHLRSINLFQIDLDPDTAPLCYPFWNSKEGIRDYLIGKRIFIAQYWPEVAKCNDDGGIEQSIAREMSALPCDQRLNADSINRLLECVWTVVGRKE